MPIDFKTKNINRQDYYKILRRCIIMNGYDGTHLSGERAWEDFKKNVKVTIIPVKDAWKYKEFFDHIAGADKNFSSEMPWGKAGMNELIWAVNDKYNPLGFYIRQNVPPGMHEGLHVLYQRVIGTGHIYYKKTSPPEVKNIGQKGPAATVIVHDNWYGFKTKLKMWISWGLGVYLPLSIPYIPIKKAREMYDI